MQARVFLAALFATVLGACSSDTGIILSIHAADGRAQGTKRLELYIGAGAVEPVAEDDRFPAVWWRRAIVDPQAVSLDGPLDDRVYDMMLTPTNGLSLDAEVVYAVVGYGGDGNGGEEIVGFAHPDDFVRFKEGEIRRIDVPLIGFDPDDKTAGVTPSGCAWWTAPDRGGPAEGEIRDRAIVPIGDQDCDGYSRDAAAGCRMDGDCDDGDPDINPGQGQGCTDVDTDCCDETVADRADEDGDGVEVCQGDCVDSGGEPDMFGQTVPAVDIHPGQPDDTCNGVDEACKRNNGGGCDGDVVDPDSDGYITCRFGASLFGSVRQTNCHTFTVPDCLEAGMANGIPADEIHPEAEDSECDGVDQDCDHHCDNGAPLDVDGDGFSRCPNTGDVDAVGGGLPTCGPRVGDCDDGDEFGQPGAFELCDGIDSMCDDVPSNNRRACLPITTVPGQCTIGAAQCDEHPGVVAFGPCMTMASGGPMLPDSYCAPCPGNDPLNCENDTRFRSCGIHTTPATGTAACALPLQQVALQTCLNCTWSLENGTDVNGWRVTLVDVNNTNTSGPPSPTVTGTLVVLRAMLVGPAHQGFIIKRTAPAGEVTFEVIQLRHDLQICGPVICMGGPG